MKGAKLEDMKRTDMRMRRVYTKWKVEMCRMAFRLETYQFDCRANMPTRYGRDLRCRGCSPRQEQEQEEQGARSKEQEELQKEQHEENQEHLEVCLGYAELWSGLGPATEESESPVFYESQD